MLRGRQRRLDANKDGKISGADFKLLRKKKQTRRKKTATKTKKKTGKAKKKVTKTKRKPRMKMMSRRSYGY